MGTSVESQDYVHRVRTISDVPAKIRFLSIEPLLGPIVRLPLSNIDWVIVGGESGPGRDPYARPGSGQYVIAVSDSMFLFSLSNGEAFTSQKQVGCLMAVRGTKCQLKAKENCVARKSENRWQRLLDLVALDDQFPARESGYWAEHKLYFWNRYIEITTTAMVGHPMWPEGLVYVDLFCGSGVCVERRSRKRFTRSSYASTADITILETR